MNFEFIQNIKGLKELYTPCKDAEELAVSKPYLSMTAARKSAEALAHYIYLQAYKEEARNMNFVDILSDYVVKRYINSRFVLDALHHIRKSGNSAVHGEINQTADQAVDLLEDLHYALGETAKREHLVKSYPRFNGDVKENPEAEYHDFDPVKLAEAMAAETIARYKAEKLMEEFHDFCSPIHFIPGDMDLVECLEWHNSSTDISAIPIIQQYFGYFAMKAIKYQYGEEDHEREMRFDASLTIYGEHPRKISGLIDFMDGLMYELPKAEGFKIQSTYYGPCFAGMVDNEIEVPFYDHYDFANQAGNKNVSYKSFEFLYNHGEGCCRKFENGKWLDLTCANQPGILNKDFGTEWWCWNLDLCVDFDFDKYPKILQALQETVRKHIPDDQLQYCEQSWEDEDYQILISSITWCPRKLQIVQNFLDEINAILAPIKDECACDAMGEWTITSGPDATARWIWDQDHFEIIGCEL